MNHAVTSAPAAARRIVLVEDDAELRSLTAAMLGEEGYEVTALPDGRTLDAHLARARPDLLLLDVMLPGEDGLSLCRRLAGRGLPIIMLTARGADIDRIIGLELGADDYLPKPFNPRELVARIRAVLRRATRPRESARETADFLSWRVDIAARSLTELASGREVALSSGEFDLLMCFVSAPGRVLSRDQLLDATRNRGGGPFDRAIDVQVSKLRRKLGDDPARPQIIKTIRGGGYMFAPAVRRSLA